MAAIHHQDDQGPNELLVASVMKIHASVAQLESLRPSRQVNSLLSQLVHLCTLPSSIDIHVLSQEVQPMRENLIKLCGEAEGLLELEYSIFLSNITHPLDHLNLFPYYDNYIKLVALEHGILSSNGVVEPKRVAFVGSGPMPLTSILMATHHMTSTHIDSYDIDDTANSMARRLIATDPELERRMRFKTRDIMDVREELGSYECIFLAALVGMRKEEKVVILGHIRKYMKSGGYMLVRSANGARGFLYPVVEEEDLHGFEVLTVFHPTDDVVNSVVLVRKTL